MTFDKLKLNLRQIDFTNLMKFNDLNFMYTDYQGEYYDYYAILKSKETDPELIEFRASKLTRESFINNNRESTKFSEDDFKEKDILNKIIMFAAKISIPELSICLYQNEKIFTELVLFEKSLEYLRKVNDTKEIDVLIKKIEVYHYIDNYNKEPILSDFLNPNQEQQDSKWIGKGVEKGRVHQFDMKLLIDTDREKSYMIKINNIKSIFRMDNLFLIKTFFTEGFPYYDEVGIDLPNMCTIYN
jgi:hypothetical protein